MVFLRGLRSFLHPRFRPPIVGSKHGSLRLRTVLEQYVLISLFRPQSSYLRANICADMGISILNTVSGLWLAELVPVYVRARTIGASVGCANAVSVIATAVVWGTEKIDGEKKYAEIN